MDGQPLWFTRIEESDCTRFKAELERKAFDIDEKVPLPGPSCTRELTRLSHPIVGETLLEDEAKTFDI